MNIKTITISFFLVFFLRCAPVCLSQTTLQFNANIYNGLPSNHVYSALKDQYGYLWLSTDKGVARYNGYDFKIYSVANSIPSGDVWGIYEDKKSRLWLYGLSDKMGYIYKNKYVPVYVDGLNQVIYPERYTYYNNGIIFTTHSYNKNASIRSLLCFEYRDTVRAVASINGMPFIKDNNALYEFHTDKFNVSEIKFNGEIFYKALHCKCLVHDTTILKYRLFRYNTNLVEYKPKGTLINILNVSNCTYKKLDIQQLTHNKEYLSFVGDFSNYSYRYNNSNKLFVITDVAIHIFDSNFRIVKSYLLNELLPQGLNGYNVTHFVIDSFWNKCITSNMGLYINYNEQRHFKKISTIDLAGYSYEGSTINGVHYWWNNSLNILATITKNEKVIHKKRVVLPKIRELVPYNNDSSLLITEEYAYVLQHNTGQILHFYPKTQMISPHSIGITNYGYHFMVSAGGLFSYKVQGEELIYKLINSDIYKQLLVDTLRKAVWAYSDDKVIYYKDSLHTSVFSEDFLLSNGIHKIEKLIIDANGNIFIKDYEQLFAFDMQTLSLRKIFNNYRFNDAAISVKDNMLTMAGRFGVMFIKIWGSGSYSAPIVFANIKNKYYSYVNDLQVWKKELLLNTDRGVYTVAIPDDSTFNETISEQNQYKFILTANDTIYSIRPGDVINIDQKNRRLQFDIINPQGNGKINYSIKLRGVDSAWRDLNASETNISSTEPGNYYTLSVVAYDNVWRSDPINIQLYIVPYWWQTAWGKNIIILSAILVVIFLIVATIYITQQRLIKKNAKKNLLLELELKSMHSQINPHFIFNTLTSALDFINKRRFEDAYTHISRFSRLLRANLKSSRNRYILLADEIENLRNYIELQKTRFAHLFSYKISVDEKLMPEKMNIPSLLLQPIVENAINHGLIPKESGGLLRIDFARGATNDIICTIEDNGIGRKASRRLHENDIVKKESYGDSLIKELITVFNTYEKMGIAIEYIDKEEPLTGTIVKISIKNPHYDE